jgi:hypothetical protein
MPTNREPIRSYSTSCYRLPYQGVPLQFNLSDYAAGSPLGYRTFVAIVGGYRALAAVAQFRTCIK